MIIDLALSGLSNAVSAELRKRVREAETTDQRLIMKLDAIIERLVYIRSSRPTEIEVSGSIEITENDLKFNVSVRNVS